MALEPAGSGLARDHLKTLEGDKCGAKSVPLFEMFSSKSTFSTCQNLRES